MRRGDTAKKRLLVSPDRGRAALNRRALSAQADPAPLLDELLPLISLELRRGRRYNRPLAILALELGGLDIEPPKGRATDLVALSPRHGRLVIVLPEAGPDSAAKYAERVFRHTGVVPIGPVTFPNDALTLDALLSLVLEE